MGGWLLAAGVGAAGVGAAGCAGRRGGAAGGPRPAAESGLTKDSVSRAIAKAAAARRAKGHYVGGPDDSVAVGYGSTSRRRLTGSVASVSGDEGRTTRVLRVEELLYRVPGLRVVPRSDGTYSITVRGKASLGYGSTDPLFVFDGLPVEDGASVLRGMAPEDVDRIDVIKDADASIYGSRSANGVILIRTRHAKVPQQNAPQRD